MPRDIDLGRRAGSYRFGSFGAYGFIVVINPNMDGNVGTRSIVKMIDWIR